MMIFIIIIMILICHVYLYSTKYSHKYLLVQGLGLLVFKKSVFLLHHLHRATTIATKC